jgi:hypothetical protein
VFNSDLKPSTDPGDLFKLQCESLLHSPTAILTGCEIFNFHFYESTMNTLKAYMMHRADYTALLYMHLDIDSTQEYNSTAEKRNAQIVTQKGEQKQF